MAKKKKKKKKKLFFFVYLKLSFIPEQNHYWLSVFKLLRSLQSAVLPSRQEGQPTPFSWIISAQRPLIVENWYCSTSVLNVLNEMQQTWLPWSHFCHFLPCEKKTTKITCRIAIQQIPMNRKMLRFRFNNQPTHSSHDTSSFI